MRLQVARHVSPLLCREALQTLLVTSIQPFWRQVRGERGLLMLKSYIDCQYNDVLSIEVADVAEGSWCPERRCCSYTLV